MQHQTTPRTLLIIWLILMALTIATMIAGKVTNVASLGMMWMAVLMVVTWLKATLILNYFLDLKAATGGWNKGFIAIIVMILLIVFITYAGHAVYTG
jgi:caa(3)-type oxidase subunit IV